MVLTGLVLLTYSGTPASDGWLGDGMKGYLNA
jgi:hypothetical protein